jgi:hypothetical protein
MKLRGRVVAAFIAANLGEAAHAADLIAAVAIRDCAHNDVAQREWNRTRLCE